jgi:hypothetical protein
MIGQFGFLILGLVFSTFAFAEDVDDIITNIKMRAETGSKAKWSIATSMGYSSGPVNDIFSDFRPNLNGGTGSTDFTTFSGTVAGKYAINTQHSLFAGSGGRVITPLREGTPHGNADPKKNFHGDKVDVDNPYVNYQYLYRWSGVQSALTVSNTFYTASNLKRLGYVTNTSVGQNNLWDIGKSGFTLGVTSILSFGYFDRHTAAVKASQSDYRLELTPALEYRVNDWINARTDLYIFSVQHRRNKEDLFTVVRQKVVQGFTLGFAVTRDIYISPGIQWNPSEMKPNRTTTWVSANINIF